MNTMLWQPSAARIAHSRMAQYQAWLRARGVAIDADYASLHRWSVDQDEAFWASLWDYFQVIGERGERVIDHPADFVDYRFFPDATLNFAENILKRRDDSPALIERLETGARRELSWRD